MATEGRRVGVVTDNVSLVVALSLQGHDLDISRVQDPSRLSEYDVALIDVRPDQDPHAVLRSVPEGVDRVVIVTGAEDVSGVRLVRRPYSMDELVAAIAAPGRQDHPLPAPEDASSVEPVEPPEGPARPEASSSPEGPARPEASLSPERPERPEDTARSQDPILRVELIADELRMLLQGAAFLTSPRRFADGVAAALAAEISAENVALWQVVGDELEIVGGAGLTEGERRQRVHVRHPLLEQARASGGVVLHDAGSAGALVLGVPGVHSSRFGVALVGEGLPVDFVTVGAPTFPHEVLRLVDEFIAETGQGWRAATAVEDLWQTLGQ